MKAPSHKPPKRPAPVSAFQTGWKWRFFNFVWICLIAFLLLMLFLPNKSRTQIAISYQGQTNLAGQCVAFFVITNTGDYTVKSYPMGNVEIAGSNEMEHVGCEAGQPTLRAGETDTVKVFLPAAINRHWRFTIGYERADRQFSGSILTSEWIN